MDNILLNITYLLLFFYFKRILTWMWKYDKTCFKIKHIVCWDFSTATYCHASQFQDQHMLIQYSSQQSPGRLREGEIIYFSCEEGYRLRGASSAKCLSTGDFERSGILTYCQSNYFKFTLAFKESKYYWRNR